MRLLSLYRPGSRGPVAATADQGVPGAAPEREMDAHLGKRQRGRAHGGQQ